jgi:predicted kinase
VILSPDHFLYDADGRYAWSPERVTSAWRLTVSKTREALADPRVRKLVLLVGLPGAGKTTWLAGHHDRDVLYVDATFVRRGDRTSFVSLAREAGKPCGAVLFTTPFDLCASRNSLRPPDRSVPPEKMEEMQARLTETPPNFSEGFSEVTLVSGT